MKNLLIAQSGGPTAAINATLAGVIQKALASEEIGKIYGGIYGIKGVLEENLKEIRHIFEADDNLTLLANTPSSALGSCRYKLDNKPDTYDKIINIFKKYDIGYFIYIGGNDSMDTVLKLSNYCASKGIDDIKIMGAPKTIDNDLCVTDHTPGFGSAAKYIAATVSEIICDIRVYDIPAITIVEAMGRNTGWLTASSCLSGLNGGGSPNLIYLPEVIFDEDAFIAAAKEELKKSPYVLVVVSEGLKDKNGTYLSEKLQVRSTDMFGHKSLLSGTGRYLETLVTKEIGCKVRSIELSLMQRCSSHIASARDIEESKMLGAAALARALDGGSGEMSVIERISSTPYQFEIKTTSIENVANKEKLVPLEWMNEKTNNVNQNMIDYLYPLIQGEASVGYKNGMPEHIRLY